MGIQCFLVVQSPRAHIWRERTSAARCAKTHMGRHFARIEAYPTLPLSEDIGRLLAETAPPAACLCGYEFIPEDSSTGSAARLWVRDGQPDGQAWEGTSKLPPGAMWDADWYHGIPEFCGPDGKSIFVKCPNGFEWGIDTRASNCDSPCAKCGTPYNTHSQTNPRCEYVDSRPHQCWVRHGQIPNITVDKSGPTCGAGAGSIQAGATYHGFLTAGQFIP